MVRILATGRDRRDRVARCRRRRNLLRCGARSDFHFDLDLSTDMVRELGQPDLRVRLVQTLGGTTWRSITGSPNPLANDTA